MKVLYINGASDSGGVTTQQLAKIAPTLQISSVATVEDAVTEIRKGGWHGLLTPPTSAEDDTLTLIARLRQDRVPIAIVPIVTEWRQEFFSAAVAAGADDVLLVRGDTAVHAAETLSRIKHSPHLRPAEERRLRVLYVGKDPLVGSLLDQVPFVKAERATSAADGAIAGRTPAPGPDPLRADAVVIDDAPGESASIAVLKFVRVHAPDLPIIVLTAPNAGEAAAGVLDLGVDDCILKSGIYRRRLIASLNRVHQRHDLVVQHATIKARETRLRQIVENLPEGLAIVSADGTILAVNGAGLPLFGVTRPGDVVGRDFYGFMAPERRDDVRALVAKVGSGQRTSLTVDLHAVDNVRRTLEIDGVMLDRDARGARGVIAVLRPPRQAEEAQIARANLAAVTEEAKERVTALTAELDKAKTSHLAERSAWDSARAQLEERLQELITDADVRHGLDMRLATAEAELQEVSTARQQFEAELDAARAIVREITVSRDELAGRLDAARDELRHAVESHLSQRTEWDALHRTLETQLEESHRHGDARSDLERQLSAARNERSTVQADLDTTRSELNGARDQVAAALHQFDAIRSERQRERNDFERTIAELTADRDAMRREHDAFRAELGSGTAVSGTRITASATGFAPSVTACGPSATGFAPSSSHDLRTRRSPRSRASKWRPGSKQPVRTCARAPTPSLPSARAGRPRAGSSSHGCTRHRRPPAPAAISKPSSTRPDRSCVPWPKHRRATAPCGTALAGRFTINSRTAGAHTRPIATRGRPIARPGSATARRSNAGSPTRATPKPSARGSKSHFARCRRSMARTSRHSRSTARRGSANGPSSMRFGRLSTKSAPGVSNWTTSSPPRGPRPAAA